MSSLLLDTHVLVWLLHGSETLNATARSQLSSPENRLAISIISIWEINLLARRGRLELHPNPLTWLSLALSKFAIDEIPLDGEIVRAMSRFEFVHQDPADQFIASTAVCRDMTLVTADRNLLELSWLRSLKAN